MATIEELQALYDEAVAARHALAIGKSKASIRIADTSVDYTRATLSDLNAYIASLQRQIDQLSGGNRRSRVVRLTQTGTGY